MAVIDSGQGGYVLKPLTSLDQLSAQDVDAGRSKSDWFYGNRDVESAVKLLQEKIDKRGLAKRLKKLNTLLNVLESCWVWKNEN